MATLLLLTDASARGVLPAIRVAGLDHKVEGLALPTPRVVELAPLAVLVDAVTDPSAGFSALLDLRAQAPSLPLVVVVAEGSLERHAWHEVADEVLSPDASEAELRLRMTMLGTRTGASADGVVRLGPLSIDTSTYRATVDGRPLNLTYKEFELLRFLASHPGQAFTRERLLQEVWGYGFYGGTRTVDVHVRRLRAKLGPAGEGLIETVRSVGYRAASFAL